MSARHVLLIAAGCIALAANADAAPQGFKAGSVVLYQPDAPLSARLSSDAELASYIKRLEAACTTFFASENTPEQLDIVVGLKPQKKVRVWFVSSRRSSQDKSLRALRAKLEAILPCEVHSGPVAFALCCTVAGASPRKDKEPYEPPEPKEWREAIGNKPVLIPDGIFAKIWRN
jgi:hypothetical protein